MRALQVGYWFHIMPLKEKNIKCQVVKSRGKLRKRKESKGSISEPYDPSNLPRIYLYTEES